MSLRRTFALALNELRHITRDVRTLLLVTVSPAFMLFMLAYVFSFDVEHADLAVMDLDKSQTTRDYIAGLTSSNTLSVMAYVNSYDAIDRLLIAGTVDAVLVIPPGFGKELQAGRTARVQAVVVGREPVARAPVERRQELLPR